MTEYGAAQAFVEKAFVHDGDDCLTWPFSTVRGYGHLGYRGKAWLAHRLVCHVVHGEPPTSKHEAAHSCGNGHRGCVNPKHLRWATSKENKADKVAHGTELFGERNPSAKLSQADAARIRSLKGMATCRDLAKQFGVSRSQISDIQTGKAWAL